MGQEEGGGVNKYVRTVHEKKKIVDLEYEDSLHNFPTSQNLLNVVKFLTNQNLFDKPILEKFFIKIDSHYWCQYIFF